MASILNNLSIMIVTMNRPKYIRTTLDYYKNFPGNIIIVDGSHDKHDYGLIRNNVNIIRIKGENYMDRIKESISHVHTPYVVARSDRRFTTLRGMEKSVDFLENNDSYSVSHGRYFDAHPYPIKSSRVIPNFYWNSYCDIVGDTPLERIINHVKPEYSLSFYGVARREVWEKITDTWDNSIENAYLYELWVELIMSMMGGIRTLPIMYNFALPGDPHPKPEHNEKRYDYPLHRDMKSCQLFVDKLANVVSDYTASPLQDARQAVKTALNGYIETNKKLDAGLFLPDMKAHFSGFDPESYADLRDVSRLYPCPSAPTTYLRNCLFHMARALLPETLKRSLRRYRHKVSS